MDEERLQGPETAGIASAQRTDGGRRAVLDVFIIGLVVLTGAALVLDLAGSADVSYAYSGDHMAATVVVFSALGALWWLNRRGATGLATWLCLLLILFPVSTLVEGAVFDRLLIIYAVPVVSAAFLLRPGASFLFAALALGAYTVTWFAHDKEPGFNYVSWFAIAGLSLVAYVVSATWQRSLDAQEEYRCELERDVVEREQAEQSLLARERELDELTDELQAARGRAADALAAVTELRDAAAAAHQRRVAALSDAVGRELGLSQRALDRLRLAAGVHDVGMACVPAAVLAGEGPLGEAASGLVRAHPEAVRPALERLAFPSAVVDIVAQHHERPDGSGYPRGLAAGEIRLEARILAVADSVAAMTAERPYRKSLEADEALEALRRGSGTRYDPAVVSACARVFEKGFAFEC